MWPGDLYKAVVLSPADPSFIEIAKRFVAETGLPASNIIKVQNQYFFFPRFQRHFLCSVLFLLCVCIFFILHKKLTEGV